MFSKSVFQIRILENNEKTQASKKKDEQKESTGVEVGKCKLQRQN